MSIFETALLQFFGFTALVGIVIGAGLCLYRKFTENEHPV